MLCRLIICCFTIVEIWRTHCLENLCW